MRHRDLNHRKAWQRSSTTPAWADLEPGIWETVFQKLTKSDKYSVRLVSRGFKASASRTIKTLELRLKDSTEDADLRRLAVRPFELTTTDVFWEIPQTNAL